MGRRKPVLVQLTEELVEGLDALGDARGASRSALVRDAVERYIVRESEVEKNRRLVRGYERVPPDDSLDRWTSDALLDMLEEESW